MFSDLLDPKNNAFEFKFPFVTNSEGPNRFAFLAKVALKKSKDKH